MAPRPQDPSNGSGAHPRVMDPHDPCTHPEGWQTVQELREGFQDAREEMQAVRLEQIRQGTILENVLKAIDSLGAALEKQQAETLGNFKHLYSSIYGGNGHTNDSLTVVFAKAVADHVALVRRVEVLETESTGRKTAKREFPRAVVLLTIGALLGTSFGLGANWLLHLLTH